VNDSVLNIFVDEQHVSMNVNVLIVFLTNFFVD